jgi:hypothetical protein
MWIELNRICIINILSDSLMANRDKIMSFRFCRLTEDTYKRCFSPKKKKKKEKKKKRKKKEEVPFPLLAFQEMNARGRGELQTSLFPSLPSCSLREG